MKQINKIKSMLSGIGLSLLAGGVSAAAAPSSTILAGSELSSTTQAQSATKLQDSVLSATSPISSEELTNYQKAVLALTKEEKADIRQSKGTNLNDLFGESNLIIKDDGDNKIMLTPPKACELFAAGKDPSNYMWTILKRKSGQTDDEKSYFYRNGALFDSQTGTVIETFEPQSAYIISTTPLLKSLSGAKKELRLTMDRKRIEKYGLQDVFFKNTFYTKKYQSKPEVDITKYDGCYVVFSEDVRVGGKEGIIAKVKPYVKFGGTLLVDQGAVRDLELTNAPPKTKKTLEQLAKDTTDDDSDRSQLPRSYLRGSVGYGSRADTITTTTTDAKNVKVADNVEKLAAAGIVLNTEGRINFEKLLNSYLAGDANVELFNGDYKLTNVNGKATVGYLGNNLGIGAGYGVSRNKIQNLGIGDDFTVDNTRNYSGPVLEAILRGDSTESRIAASFMKGNETQDLRNSQVPGFVRTTGDNSASLKVYQALVRQILGKNVEADLTGRYSESKSFGRETSEGQLGLEGKYNWKNLQLGAGLKAGKQLKGSNGVSASYQQLYGSAGFRF